MSNLAEKFTDDLNIDQLEQMSDQLAFNVQKAEKLVELNKQLLKAALEYKAVNNSSYGGKVDTPKNTGTSNKSKKDNTKEENEETWSDSKRINVTDLTNESVTETEETWNKINISDLIGSNKKDEEEKTKEEEAEELEAKKLINEANQLEENEDKDKKDDEENNDSKIDLNNLLKK